MPARRRIDLRVGERFRPEITPGIIPGLQDETSVLDVPCLTLRKNTGRPVMINEGTDRWTRRRFKLFSPRRVKPFRCDAGLAPPRVLG